MLKLAQKGMHGLVNSNLFISLCALALVQQTYLQTTGALRWDAFSILVFFGTLHVYLAQRMVKVNNRANYHSAGMSLWLLQHKWYVLPALVASFITAGIFFLKLQSTTQIGLIVMGGVSMMYGLPMLFFTGTKTSLRDYGIGKPFILGAVWGITTALLPILELDRGFTTGDFWLVLERVMFLCAICLPFDIKDMEFDANTMKYRTLPNRIGVKATLTVAIVLVVVSWNISLNRWLFVTDGIDFWAFVAYSVVYQLSIIMLLRVDEQSDEYYYTFLLDGLLLLLPVLLYLMHFCSV